MDCSWWTLHNVAHADTLWLSTLIADPATSSLHLEYLSVLVMMPVRPRTRQERDMVAHYALHRPGELIHPENTTVSPGPVRAWFKENDLNLNFCLRGGVERRGVFRASQST
jgi:hypothetical protein